MHTFHIYDDMKQANDVVDRLLAAGINRKDISVLATEAAGANHFALTKGTKALEGGGLGASIGGAIGLLGGALLTSATAGVGILAAGPILVGFAGLGAGATVGGLAGALVGAGIPEAEAKYYAQEIAGRDAILVGVEVPACDQDMVRSIMTPARDKLGIRSPAYAGPR